MNLGRSRQVARAIELTNARIIHVHTCRTKNFGALVPLLSERLKSRVIMGRGTEGRDCRVFVSCLVVVFSR